MSRIFGHADALGQLPKSRPTGSNPFHPSRGPLAAILPLFPRRLQFPIPIGLNLLLMPGEHVLRRDVTDAVLNARRFLGVTPRSAGFFKSLTRREQCPHRSHRPPLILPARSLPGRMNLSSVVEPWEINAWRTIRTTDKQINCFESSSRQTTVEHAWHFNTVPGELDNVAIDQCA